MELTVINSGSVGNCYLFDSGTSVLIVECGVSFKQIKEALNFNLRNVCGALVTHEHMDHCKSVAEVAESGIDIYTSAGTIKAFHEKGWYGGSHRYKAVKQKQMFTVGEFKIIPFDVQHDCNEPLGFLINHEQCGNVLFVTDTYYVKHKFPGLNNILVEANYCKDIIAQKIWEGKIGGFLKNRIVQSHMSLQTCQGLLQANDLKAVNNIVLIHLSDSNSDAVRFQNTIQADTGKKVHVATKGLKINLDKRPF
ncbi:MAG: MBL fold metallo-hydrolase [Acinetobacter sp.]|uniref:MBL fold metallo-hydrolase n=1 Tax=Acinetobacter sp. TaxID=472 RepID=UPI000FC0CE1A|nr:MBL fold metallo-hydrolase [Acinetobacter sp.]RUP38242.1 MAG: MBL fold metallo-hydrolase [Acinetobacter sp.]